MIDILGLKEQVGAGGDWVMLGPGGEGRDAEVPPDAGPATLIVSRVTDAVKRVGEGGLVEESVGRGGLWAVEALLLNRVVVQGLEEESLSVAELIEAVPRCGFPWQVVTSPD